MRAHLVPGFSQPAAVWDATRAALPVSVRAEFTGHEVPDGLDFVATAATIGAAGGIGLYVGYSMGGRLALQLALDHPQLVRALVLVSASAGVADPVARAARAEEDERRAEDIRTRGVRAFLADWLAQPLFSTLAPADRMVDARVGAMDPERLARQMTRLGQGAMAPLWDRLAELRMPVTIVVGRADTRYRELGHVMADRIARAELVEVAGGHAVPLEQPAELAAVLAAVHAATS